MTDEIKDWNEFWSKYRIFKIEREWLETNYPEVLKAWKEHRQPIILKRIYDEEQNRIAHYEHLLKKFNEVEKFLDSKPDGLSEDMEKAIRLSIELGRNDDANIDSYWQAIKSLGRYLENWPIRRGR